MSESRPATVTVAAILLIVDAIVGALSVHVLFSLSSSSQGWSLPFQPLVWFFALLQILAAVLLLRRAWWMRYLWAAVVLLLLGDSLVNTTWPQSYASFPLATVRDAASLAVQLLSVGLLFTPTAARWFNRIPTPARDKLNPKGSDV